MAPRPGSTFQTNQIPAQGGKTPIVSGPNIDPVRPRPFENGPGPRIPAQGGKTQPALPPGFQSPYANYGFDPGLQSYLDRQNYMSNNDAGVAFQYDPTNQTFTGGTRGGTYNPIPLSVMQQAAGGNRDVLNPYFQSRFPQPTGPVPTIKPGMQPRPTLPVQQPTLAPSRGPAPRTIQPMVTQGLAGLVNRRR